MFRLFKSLAKPQSAPLQILSKASKFTFAPLYHFTSNIHKNHSTKTLSYHPSASFSAFAFTKSPENHYIQDLRMIKDHSVEELASFQQILKKYIASQDFADFNKEDSSRLLKAFFQLAKVCYETPKREGDSLKYYEEALAFAKTVGIKDSKEVGFIYNGMAFVLYIHQRFDEALTNLEKAKEMFEKLGLDSESHYPYVQNIYLQGSLNLSKGNIEKAEEYFQIALQVSEGIPESVVEVLHIDIYEGLAYANFKKNNLEQAHEYAIKALDSIYKVYGEDNARGIALSRDLACSLYSQEKFDDALSYAQKLNHTLKHNRDAGNYEVIQSLALIGQIYTKKNDFANATANFKQVLDILEKSPKAFQDADTFYILTAKSYFAEGKVQEATEIFNKAISLISNKHGESGVQTANVLASWGQTLESNENSKKDALGVYQRALEIYKKLGAQHIPDVIQISTRLSDVARQIGNYKESIEHGQQALKLCAESGQNLYWLEDINSLLGITYIADGQLAEGLKHLEEAVRICEESDNKSRDLHSHYYLLADSYLRNKDMEKAEKAAKKTLELSVLRFGKEHSETEISLALLLNILNAQKKTDDIARVLQIFGIGQAEQQGGQGQEAQL